MNIGRFRKSKWIDIEKLEEKFGIKAEVDGKFIDAGDNDGLFLFDTEEERDSKIAELREKYKKVA